MVISFESYRKMALRETFSHEKRHIRQPCLEIKLTDWYFIFTFMFTFSLYLHVYMKRFESYGEMKLRETFIHEKTHKATLFRNEIHISTKCSRFFCFLLCIHVYAYETVTRGKRTLINWSFILKDTEKWHLERHFPI